MKKFLLAVFALAAMSAGAFTLAPAAPTALEMANAKPVPEDVMHKIIENAARRVKQNGVRPVTKISDVEGAYSWAYQLASARVVNPDTANIMETGSKDVFIINADDDAASAQLLGMFDAPVTLTLDLTTYGAPTLSFTANEIVSYATLSGSINCQCSIRGYMYLTAADNGVEADGWYYNTPIIFLLDDGTVGLPTNVWLSRYIVNSTNGTYNGYTLNPVWLPGSRLTEKQVEGKVGSFAYTYNGNNYTYPVTYTEDDTYKLTINNFGGYATNPAYIQLKEDKTWEAELTVLSVNDNGSYTLYAATATAPTTSNLTGTGDETTLTSDTNWCTYDAQTRYWQGSRGAFTMTGEFVWPGNTAVEGVNAVKSVSSVKYVNIAGQVSANPFSGMNVVITNYTDGTQSVAKVIK